MGAPHPELAHAYPQAVEWQGNPPPLPTDVCERLAEVAIDLARVHADERIAQIESELRLRLQKTLLRLSTFYRQRIEELDPEDENTPSIRQQLAQELDQKTADELARQQVHVTITPINWAILSVPYQQWNLTWMGEPLAQPNVLEHYTWHAGQNDTWTVYYGEHRWGKSRLWAIIVAAREGEIRYQYRTGLVRAVLDALRNKLPLRRQIETARLVASDIGRPGRARNNRRNPMP